jgi:DNA-binding NarL/FixJ family response regulator
MAAAIRICFAFADPALAERMLSLLAHDSGLDLFLNDDSVADVVLTDQAGAQHAPSILIVDDAQSIEPDAETRAVLPSSIEGELLRASIRIVSAGFVISDADRTPRFSEEEEIELTARESEVLSLLMHGSSNKAIARELDISVHTAKFHMASLIAKLGARNRSDAIAIAIRRGLALL